MPNLFQTPAIVQSIRTLVDGGCKLDIVTRELLPNEMTELFSLKNCEGWLLFKSDPINLNEIKEIPEEPLEKFQKKSPSQRLHDRLFVYYKATHQDTKKFNDFYINVLESLGQQYLDKIKS